MFDRYSVGEKMKVHIFDGYGEKVVDIKNIFNEDTEFFERNNVKVSMEELNGEFVVYACPYEDESEESELIEFAGNRSCQDTLHALAEEYKNVFGVN